MNSKYLINSKKEYILILAIEENNYEDNFNTLKSILEEKNIKKYKFILKNTNLPFKNQKSEKNAYIVCLVEIFNNEVNNLQKKIYLNMQDIFCCQIFNSKIFSNIFDN